MNDLYSSTLIKKNSLDSWEDLPKEFYEYNPDLPYIYRGHSNHFDKTSEKFIHWKLDSSFNRKMSEDQHTFSTLLSQQYSAELFNKIFSGYKLSNIRCLNNSSLLEKIYIFQHYGIPTCFIDFTYHPLIALYFSLSEIIIPNVISFSNNSPNTFNEDWYFSIYQLNYKLLNKILGIKILDNNSTDCQLNEPQDYHKFVFDLDDSTYYHILLDLHPKSIILNYNLENQKSCFLLFDNHLFGQDQISFEDVLTQYGKIKGISLDEPILNIYNIKYNSIINRLKNGKKNVFKFLIDKNITGKYLFDDIQGLKYDYINFFGIF